MSNSIAIKTRAPVRWFNDGKGYGMIELANGRLCFVHYTAILDPGFKTLVEGQLVDFDLIDGPKGPQAASVTKVGV